MNEDENLNKQDVNVNEDENLKSRQDLKVRPDNHHTLPIKFFLFLSSTGGTPTTTERP